MYFIKLFTVIRCCPLYVDEPQREGITARLGDSRYLEIQGDDKLKTQKHKPT